LSYLVDVCERYVELAPLGNLLDEVIPAEQQIDRL